VGRPICTGVAPRDLTERALSHKGLKHLQAYRTAKGLLDQMAVPFLAVPAQDIWRALTWTNQRTEPSTSPAELPSPGVKLDSRQSSEAESGSAAPAVDTPNRKIQSWMIAEPEDSARAKEPLSPSSWLSW
jgi:hypothetical protein